MPQPVKLSDALVLEARLAGEVFQRSIAGQVEYWARLGRSLEDVLDGRHARALAQAGGVRPLSELMDTVETSEGRQRLAEYLDSTPYPHYEEHPEEEGLLLRTLADGSRSAGRFVNRQFVIDEGHPWPEAEYTTPNELAAEFAISPKTVRDWLRTLPQFQDGGYTRYRLRKDGPVVEEAAKRFRKDSRGVVKKGQATAVSR